MNLRFIDLLILIALGVLFMFVLLSYLDHVGPGWGILYSM